MSWFNMAKIPFDDLKRNFFATRPEDVDGVFNTSVVYYREYLLKKIFSIFEWHNVPDTWEMDYVQSVLFLEGCFAIVDTVSGVLPLRCAYAGMNIFDEPTTIIIANHVLGNFERTIGADGALVRLQFDFGNINAMLNRYAYLLASCDSALSVNLMNSKVTFIAMAENKAQAETMKKMYDQISMGKPAVFVKASAVQNGEGFFFNHVKENFVGTELQDVKRTIINEFLTEIGINNANTDKRERLNTEEVSANDDEIRANVQHWLENINTGLQMANDIFGLNVSVSVRNYAKITGKESGEDESAELG